MEQLMLEQFMKLSEQIGEIKTDIKFRFEKLESEMRAGFKAHDERFASLEAEMRAGFKVHDEKFASHDEKITSLEEKVASLEAEMRAGFEQQSIKNDKIQQTLEENFLETAEIFNDIFKILGQNEKKIANLSR